VGGIYKELGLTELFFEAFKQKLRTKAFMGTLAQRGADSGLYNTDRDAADEVPAAQVELRLKPVEPFRHAALQPVGVSGLVGLARRALRNAPLEPVLQHFSFLAG
jgi:hypothetical protein